jgi:hypothetical protein
MRFPYVLCLALTLQVIVAVPRSSAQDCGCGSYVDLATKTAWFTSSTDHQQYLFKLLSLVDKSFDEFNKAASSGGEYNVITEIAGGHLDASSLEKHNHEISTYLRDQLIISYKTDTKVGYPLDLISGMRECHQSCAAGTDISCGVFAISDKDVVFSVTFQSNLELHPKFIEDVILPSGVKAAQPPTDRLLISDKAVMRGPNFYTLDRSGHPDIFPLTFKTDLKQCYQLAPPMGKTVLENSPKASNYSHYCELPLTFSSQPTGHVENRKCSNMPPGGRFLAVYTGQVMVDREDKPMSSWVTVSLGSPLVQTPQANAGNTGYSDRKLDRDDANVFALAISGTVPNKSDDHGTVGEVPVRLTLEHCATTSNMTECSTRGESVVTIMAIDP